jgi:hypothetical protein
MGNLSDTKAGMGDFVPDNPTATRGWSGLTTTHRIGRGRRGLVTIDTGESVQPALAPEGRSAALRKIALHQCLRQLREEDGGHGRLAHATPKTTLAGMGQEKTLLGTSDAHITKPPFLLKGRRVVQGAVTREKTLL